MDRFVTAEARHLASSNDERRYTWRHALAQVRGRMDSSHKQALFHTMLRTFSEIGRFSQVEPGIQQLSSNSNEGMPPSTSQQGFSAFLNHPNQSERRFVPPSPIHRPYISSLDFDSKGVYLASVSSIGSLAIHDYESLYCHAQGSSMGTVMPVMQLQLCQKLAAVSWNPKNWDEVACVAAWGGKVYCYDISRVTNNPSQVLKVSSNTENTFESTGLFDLVFCKIHEKRVLACGRHGEIHVWDRRINNTPQSVFSCQQCGHLSSLALTRDEQVIYACSSSGQLHAWDFRGGRSSAAFITPGKLQVYNPPFTTWKVATLLEKIPSLTAQTEIELSGIQSIRLNQCCDQQLAFHLNNGWSGVLDLSILEVTHIHCPPPPWLYNEGGEGIPIKTNILQRKPTWLSVHSIYACASSSGSKINFLDFKRGHSSPHHVEDNGNKALAAHVEISTSESIVACATHPLNDHIVAGTEEASILVIGHKRDSTEEDNHEA